MKPLTLTFFIDECMEWTHGRPRPPWQSAEVGCRIDIKLFSDAFIRCEFTLWVFVNANFAARVASYGLSQQLVVDAVAVLLVMSLPHHFLCWWSIFPYSSGLENCLILVRLVNQQLAQEHWSLLIGLFLWTNIIFFNNIKCKFYPLLELSVVLFLKVSLKRHLKLEFIVYMIG